MSASASSFAPASSFVQPSRAGQHRAGTEVTPAMDPRITPDLESVLNAVRDIRSTSDEIKDELLTELLVRSYPVRVSQDN